MSRIKTSKAFETAILDHTILGISTFTKLIKHNTMQLKLMKTAQKSGSIEIP